MGDGIMLELVGNTGNPTAGMVAGSTVCDDHTMGVPAGFKGGGTLI